MKNKKLIAAATLLFSFAFWTLLIATIDVRPVGVSNTNIGLATLNTWFHKLIGVHMSLYVITDWLSLLPLSVCAFFAGIGLGQLIRRKSLKKVDMDIIFLGVYYILVILCFIGFEIFPINYRPILIEGVMEASYPSSTTMLVLCVMPTLIFQAKRRFTNETLRKVVYTFTYFYSAFMVVGRLLSGVHWLTDIVSGVLLSAGLFLIYVATVEMWENRK